MLGPARGPHPVPPGDPPVSVPLQCQGAAGAPPRSLSLHAPQALHRQPVTLRPSWPGQWFLSVPQACGWGSVLRDDFGRVSSSTPASVSPSVGRPEGQADGGSRKLYQGCSWRRGSPTDCSGARMESVCFPAGWGASWEQESSWGADPEPEASRGWSRGGVVPGRPLSLPHVCLCPWLQAAAQVTLEWCHGGVLGIGRCPGVRPPA